MDKKFLKSKIGKLYRVVTKVGEEHKRIIVGIIVDVDFEDGFLLIDSNEGLGIIGLDTILEFKQPTKKQLEKYKGRTL